MATNFVETIKNYFTSEFTNRASNSLNESDSGISKALTALIPAGLGGILGKATSSSEGASSVFNMAKNAASNFSASPAANADTNDDPGGFLSGIFGNSTSGISSAISKFSGISGASATSLLGMAIPSIMGLLGKHSEENNLSADGLSGFLSSQKDNITSAMPSGMPSLSGMLGLGSLGTAASSLASKAPQTADIRVEEVTENRGGGMKWLLPLLLILAAIALIWYFSKSCNKGTETVVPDTDSLQVDANNATSDMANTVTDTNTVSFKVKLPNGKELDANKGGIEDQLVVFLSSDWKSLSDEELKSKWFNFDNLNFNLGNAVLTAESEKQLDNLAEILRAFPDAKIKIGGYTDASGNAAANKTLSQQRAEAAKAGLEKRGVGAQVTDAEGFGSEFAKFPADASDAERATDRKVAVSVRK